MKEFKFDECNLSILSLSKHFVVSSVERCDRVRHSSTLRQAQGSECGGILTDCELLRKPRAKNAGPASESPKAEPACQARGRPLLLSAAMELTAPPSAQNKSPFVVDHFSAFPEGMTMVGELTMPSMLSVRVPLSMSISTRSALRYTLEQFEPRSTVMCSRSGIYALFLLRQSIGDGASS